MFTKAIALVASYVSTALNITAASDFALLPKSRSAHASTAQTQFCRHIAERLCATDLVAKVITMITSKVWIGLIDFESRGIKRRSFSEKTIMGIV